MTPKSNNENSLTMNIGDMPSHDVFESDLFDHIFTDGEDEIYLFI